MTTRDHLKLVGVIHAVWNLLGLLGAGGFFLVTLLVAGAAGGVVGHERGAEQGTATVAVVGGVGTLLALLVALPAIPGFVGGVGLLKGWSWSRPLLLVVSAVQVLTLVPIPLIVGGYSLWALWPEEAADALAKRDVAWLPAD